MRFTFIDGEKLCIFQDGKVEKYESTFLTHYRETALQETKRKEWKKDSEYMMYDRFMDGNTRVIARLCAISPTKEENKLVYTFTVNGTSGVYYKYTDDEKKTEAHYLTSNEDSFVNLVAYENGDMLGTVQNTPLTSNIALFSATDGEYKTVTGGDSKDENPIFAPNREIYFNSYGVGRDMNNEFVCYAPSEILKLNLHTMDIETILSDPKYSYIKPMLDGKGNLYCIQKSGENEEKGNPLLSILLAPIRIMEAIIGFISTFVRIFTGKPLMEGKGKTRSGGGAVKMPSEEDFMIHNMRLNVEKEMKNNQKEEDGGFIPRTFKLVKIPKNPDEFISQRIPGMAVTLASGVADYTLAQENGETVLLYTNGKRIFAIYENGEKKKLCHTDFCVHIGALQSSQTETDLFGNI